MDEKLIEKHMRTLQCTREEAIQLIQDDIDVDHGIAKPWDLTKEQMKNARKMANVTTRKSSGTVKKTKKENPMKRAVMLALENALKEFADADNVTLSNPEKAIDFTGSDGINYTVTLTAHRK